MKLADILRAGKANIESKGHAKGDDVWAANKSRGCCVITALPYVMGTKDNIAAIFRRANGISDQQSIGNWSDEATKEEVLAAFDKAITLAEQENA